MKKIILTLLAVLVLSACSTSEYRLEENQNVSFNCEKIKIEGIDCILCPFYKGIGLSCNFNNPPQ